MKDIILKLIENDKAMVILAVFGLGVGALLKLTDPRAEWDCQTAHRTRYKLDLITAR
jgi:hypothetical protein